MRFALLGYNQTVHDLVQQLGSASEHSLVAVALADDCNSDAASPLPSNVLPSTLLPKDVSYLPWESLLAGGDDVDAIIVGDAQRTRLQEPLRKLTQAGLPLVISHPSCDVILAFELEMIRRDVGGILLPYFAGMHDRAFARLTQWSPNEGQDLAGTSSPQAGATDASWGRIQQVTMQRHTESTERRAVEQQFAQDAYWLRRLLGPFDRLGALGPRGEDNLANLSVHMSADRALAKWSLLPASDPNPTTLAIVGDDKMAQLTYDDVTRAWSLQFARGGDPIVDSGGNADSDLTTIVELLRNPAAAALEWEHACRAVELVETVGRSLRRGKTVELYNEDVTEEDTFKSLMAAGGCGVLLLALMAILLMAVIETLEIPLLEADFFHHWPGRLLYWRNWPIYLVGTLILFLGLQLLKLAFPTRNPPE